MESFNTSLVREKIIFTGSEGGEPVVIRSNRMFLLLGAEKIVVRAQNMHSTLRLAAKILQEYQRAGAFMTRTPAVEWDKLWGDSLSSYEKEFNPDIWAAVYVGGRSVFKTSSSPFMDVIEKCALITADNYDATMEVTENALKQVGHAMQISHASSIAAVLTDAGESTRCSVIHRSGKKDTAFSFTAFKGERKSRVVQAMSATAAYLEAFSLLFTIQGIRGRDRPAGEKGIRAASQAQAAITRQGAINRAIHNFDDVYGVTYRPARPDLFSNL